jgi:hypothetical protein
MVGFGGGDATQRRAPVGFRGGMPAAPDGENRGCCSTHKKCSTRKALPGVHLANDARTSVSHDQIEASAGRTGRTRGAGGDRGPAAPHPRPGCSIREEGLVHCALDGLANLGAGGSGLREEDGPVATSSRVRKPTLPFADANGSSRNAATGVRQHRSTGGPLRTPTGGDEGQPFAKPYPGMPKHLTRLVPASSGLPVCEDRFTSVSRRPPALSPPQAFSVSEDLPATPAQGQQRGALERTSTWLLPSQDANTASSLAQVV